MTFLLKDPNASLDYAVDWGSDYLSDDVLEASDWTLDPVELGGAAIDTSHSDLLIATVKVSGGVAGHVYRLTNQVVTASGRVDSRSIMLRVEKR